jgi:hypothetical protein
MGRAIPDAEPSLPSLARTPLSGAARQHEAADRSAARTALLRPADSATGSSPAGLATA